MELSGDLIVKEVLKPDFAAFDKYALEIFHFQYKHNEIYRQFCDTIGRKPGSVNEISKIPFLPIRFFKSHQLLSTQSEPEIIFESSGTTGSINSKHFIKDARIYKKSYIETFQIFFEDPSRYCIIGLLPSYLERENSSLVYMVNDFVALSNNEKSGFYLYDHAGLAEVLKQNEADHIPTILFGVTYALLDFAEAYPLELNDTVIIETGGMKGRKKELTRTEVHDHLKKSFGLKEIFSEYGMTELLSQAYSAGKELFIAPPWMKIIIRAEDDPFELYVSDQSSSKPISGAVNIIDLANLYSCSFIATDDFGKLYPDGKFEILGRLDNSDSRGCGLMII